MSVSWFVVSYLVGSLPFAFLLARRSGVDLRAVGSGNLGASNVFRTTSKTTGVVVALLDVIKGAAVVLIARRFEFDLSVQAVSGVAAVIGHVFPVWLRFRGGKGVATTCGAFAVLAPGAVAWLAIGFGGTLWVGRYVSVASMVAAGLLGPVSYATGAPPVVVVAACLSGLLVVFRHRSNVSRIRLGTERRVGQRA